jgi:bifunctional non-homologous end joining protein LigD
MPHEISGSIPLTETIDHHSLMHLSRATMAFRDPAWAWEVKFDGYRMLAFREGKRARLLSRSGRDSGLSFPEVLQALMPLQIDCVLDCELTIPDEHGRPDWHALAPRTAMRRPIRIIDAAIQQPARLYAFDILALDGKDLRPMPLRDRRIALAAVLTSAPGIKLSEQWADGPALYRSVIANELEGIVGKRLDSAYRAERSDCWVKVRAPTSRPQDFG